MRAMGGLVGGMMSADGKGGEEKRDNKGTEGN